MLLVHPAKDAAIPKSAVTDAGRLMPHCGILDMPGLGHLAHEEEPEQAMKIIAEFAKAEMSA
jgi:magnesium chelatase accessory protein